MSEPNDTPEFDRHAESYDATTNDFLKRLIGGKGQGFIVNKARWIVDYLNQEGKSSEQSSRPPRILDYGCGTAVLLEAMRKLSVEAELEGCDVSPAMLDEARRKPWHGATPKFWEIGSREPEDRYDIVVMSCVLHHVDLTQRSNVVAKAAAMLRPGGSLVVFEHNPLNPLTVAKVKTSPLDVGVILLPMRETRKLAEKADLLLTRNDYIFFMPPRWEASRRVDAALRNVPFGAQYVTAARKH